MSKKLAVLDVDVVVLGSGPGGYSAAFRAADLGLNVALVERGNTLGGVCLNVGCIPSKALLHAAEVLNETKSMAGHGIDFGKPKIDITALKQWKEGIVGSLTQGLQGLAKQRKVTVVSGVGEFASDYSLSVATQDGAQEITFKHAIIAAGSEPVKLPFLPEDERIIDSTGALELNRTDGSMLVIGGGIIGCEMATVYNALGVNVTVVEMMDQIMPGADADLAKPCQKIMADRGTAFWLKTKVTGVEAKKDGLWVSFEGDHAPDKAQKFDQILVAVGRVPNGKLVGADKAGVNVDERGFIGVDKQLRTNVPHIFAIGDICGNPMLAHKAVPEGRLVAEIIAGNDKRFFDAKCIPSVAYTDPEVAWVGVTETEAKEQGLPVEKAVFPWMASGRSLCFGRREGLTKLLVNTETHQVVGAGIVGRSAGDLISEVALAIEMGCDVEDLSLTIHPHPTLSETIMMAAEIFEGTITDLYMPKKKK